MYSIKGGHNAMKMKKAENLTLDQMEKITEKKPEKKFELFTKKAENSSPETVFLPLTQGKAEKFIINIYLPHLKNTENLFSEKNHFSYSSCKSKKLYSEIEIINFSTIYPEKGHNIFLNKIPYDIEGGKERGLVTLSSLFQIHNSCIDKLKHNEKIHDFHFYKANSWDDVLPIL